jgi:membrane protease YdiL (CAAX protease family)
MDRDAGGYLGATRHALPCLLFLLPLLIAYECGVLWLGGSQADSLRNGADVWVRLGLASLGLRQVPAAGILVLLVFAVRSWQTRAERPADLFNVLVGMALESIVFALTLWCVSRALAQVLTNALLQAGATPEAPRGLGQVLTYVGAGIYEEILFRLFLFTTLRWLLRQVTAPPLLEVGFAALASSAVFSAAHHLGPYGEAFDSTTFLFRLLAGLFFALLYHLRGFGVAVGAHACYDVLAGIAVG